MNNAQAWDNAQNNGSGNPEEGANYPCRQ